MTEVLQRSTLATPEGIMSTGAMEPDQLPTPVEPPVDAVTAPEHYAYSAIDPSMAHHFSDLSLEDQRRRAAVLYNDANGKEIVDPAAKPYSDFLREQVSKTHSFNEALELYHQHDTDPLNSIDLMAYIVTYYADTIQSDPEAQHKVAELTEENVKDVEKVVLGETDHATPEAGLRCMIVAADILADNSAAEAEVLDRLNKVTQISHDSDGILANGHLAADPLLVEAISEAISDRMQIPTTAGITLSELVEQRVEIKELDLEEKRLQDEIASKRAQLKGLRAQRDEAKSTLEQEVRIAKRRTGIRGLLLGKVRVSR